MKLDSLKMILAVFLSISFNAFSSQVDVVVTELNDDLHRPWAVEVLPDQSLVITERNGDVRVWKNNALSKSIKGLPAVFEAGQGGLLDVKAHPDFANNALLYFTYAKGSNSANATYLARAQLKLSNINGSEQYQLVNVEEIFRATPDKQRALHFSGRIEFLPDTTLIFAVGDGYKYLDQAQELDSHFGKVVRLHDDGKIPTDNPFVSANKKSNVLPEIYSYGHRNPQGMFYDDKRKLLFSNEHGPKGGDEINIISPGKNYGWPTITYGIDYSGAVISDLTHKEGMEQPLLQWTPSIAPSSIMIYYGDEFPEFYGHILTTTLKYKELRLVKLTNKNSGVLEVASQHTLLKDQGERLRDIAMNQKGQLYIVTDSGKLLQLSNAN